MIHGDGYTRHQFPGMCRQFNRFGIDIVKQPMLIYPSLHYQNGGIGINERCETNIPGLYVAGEASGGVHGRNRLMGNSVLDYNVFGRRAGQFASEYAKSVNPGQAQRRSRRRPRRRAGARGHRHRSRLAADPAVLHPGRRQDPADGPPRQHPGAALHAAQPVHAGRAEDAPVIGAGLLQRRRSQ